MKTLKMVVELEYDADLMHGDDLIPKQWFLNDVLLAPKQGEGLILHSNCIGDEVGRVKVISLCDKF